MTDENPPVGDIDVSRPSVARVYDRVAVLHGQVLLACGEGLAAVQADLAEPESVLTNPKAALCAEYMRRAAHGSWLIVSSGHHQDKGTGGEPAETPVYPLVAVAVAVKADGSGGSGQAAKSG